MLWRAKNEANNGLLLIQSFQLKILYAHTKFLLRQKKDSILTTFRTRTPYPFFASQKVIIPSIAVLSCYRDTVANYRPEIFVIVRNLSKNHTFRTIQAILGDDL